MKKQLIVIFVLIVVLAIVFAIAKQLSPTAEFIPPGRSDETVTRAPVVRTETSIIVALGQTLLARNIGLTPLEVLEDSRCPANVNCVWAGTVRVRTKVETTEGVSEKIFILALPQTSTAETIELTDVSPAPLAGSPIDPGLYRFTFKVSER